MKIFGELPSDLRKQTISKGPPPAWFRGNMTRAAFQRFGSYEFGDRESEVEANPVEVALNKKFADEYKKGIPSIAQKYTQIEPLSPMFRTDIPKFGFGEITPTTGAMVLACVGLVFLGLTYCSKQHKK